MKRFGLMATLLIAALVLTACAGNGKNDTAASDEAGKQQTDIGKAQAESTVMEAPLFSNEEPAAPVAAQTQSQEEAEGNISLPALKAAPSSEEERPVDLDLTRISGTVVYSQVYDMIADPENYIGQRIRMKGNFSYYQDPDTKQEYFAAIIADATACCAQGIEFVWKGEHRYPQDYPPLDTEITVTGTFSTYYEGDFMYVQLIEADVNW